MPVYEYRCGACGKKTEDIVLAGDAADYVPECAHCGSLAVSRLLSTFAAHGGHADASHESPCGMGACESGDMSACGMGGCGMGGGGDFDLN